MKAQWSPIASSDPQIKRYKAELNAQVGWLLGDRIQAHFFAPAPSNAEIRARISQRP